MKTLITLILLATLVPGLGACVHSAIYTARAEKNYPPSGETVSVNGKPVHVIKAGDSGPVILMIHGASANAEEFSYTLAPRLSATHRVLMADRPGHGYSGRPAKSNTLSVQAEQMAGALEALAPGEKAVIVGHSFGGGVALRLALDRPDLVEALVLLAPVSHDWGTDAQAWYTKAAARPLFGPAFTQLIPIVGPRQLENGVDGTFTPDRAPEGYIDNSAAPLLFRPAEFRANARDVTNLRTELAAQEGRYGELKMPITVYSGLRDVVIRPDLHVGKLRLQVPQLELIENADGGHMPHHADGPEIAETIRALSSSLISQ